MAELEACDFEGEGTSPSSGDNLTAANTGAQSVQSAGTFTAKFTNSPTAHEGSLAGEFVGGTGYVNLRWVPSTAKTWTVGYFYYDGTPPSPDHAVIMEAWTSTPAILGQVRIKTDGTLQARDYLTADWTSTALATGWHRLAWLIDPVGNSHRLKVYSGANLDTTTTSQDSTALALTITTGTAVEVVKVGMITSTTFTAVWDDIHIDSADEWTPDTGTTVSPTAVAATTSVGGDYGSERNALVVMGGASKQGVWG